ncbi:unnamed protein product [Pedinophyceae sp. YPF-701]|nr:unnamed protein product [Pedinophyceae sp. YPF-701]
MEALDPNIKALLTLPSEQLFLKYAGGPESEKSMVEEDLQKLFEDCCVDVANIEEEFAYADLKGDALLTLDEFGIYHHSVLKKQAGLQGALEQVFQAYNLWGGKIPDSMDARGFAHVCKDSKLVGSGLRLGDIDIIHSKVREKGERRISFEQFVYALGLVAEARKEPIDTVVARVARAGGPQAHGTTEADTVRLHDDKSTYTGVYARGGPNNFDGPATGDLSHITNRKAADVRGVTDEARERTTAGAKGPARPTRGASKSKQLLDQIKSATADAGGIQMAVNELSRKLADTPASTKVSKRKQMSEESKGWIHVALEQTGDMDRDLRAVFEAYNIFDGGDQAHMSGRAWVKIWRDRELVPKPLSTTYLDLVFAKVKGGPAARRLQFDQFKTALDHVANDHYGGNMPEVAVLVVEGGGPTAQGTIPVDSEPAPAPARAASSLFPQASDASALSRATSQGLASGRGAGLGRAASNVSNLSGGAPSPSVRLGKGVIDRQISNMIAASDVVPPNPSDWSPDMTAVYDIYEQYNAFGGNTDVTRMDGRTFAKFCREKGLLPKPLLPNDCDLVFASVKAPVAKKLSFGEFCVALQKLSERSNGALPDLDMILAAVAKLGGPQTISTTPDNVRFHDDKSTFTGVYRRGGPSMDDRAKVGNTSFLVDRDNKADVRGVPKT